MWAFPSSINITPCFLRSLYVWGFFSSQHEDPHSVRASSRQALSSLLANHLFPLKSNRLSLLNLTVTDNAGREACGEPISGLDLLWGRCRHTRGPPGAGPRRQPAVPGTAAGRRTTRAGRAHPRRSRVTGKAPAMPCRVASLGLVWIMGPRSFDVKGDSYLAWIRTNLFLPWART